MPNTVYGPYAPSTWVQGSSALNQTRMSNLELQAGIALNGFNGDLLTAFVLSGMVCTKDGTTANQLDVTPGRAYVTMSDGTRGLIITVASTPGQFTTATPSSTYYLFLKVDGTWQWSTTSSGPANSLAICQAATDGSGNILSVVDKRGLNTTLFSGMAGTLTLPTLNKLTIQPPSGYDSVVMYATDQTYALFCGSGDAAYGAGAGGYMYDGKNGGYVYYAGTKNGIKFTGALQSLGGQATAGSFGAPVIVAQALRTLVTTTGAVTILTFTIPANGLYCVRGALKIGNGTAANAPHFWVTYTDAAGGGENNSLPGQTTGTGYVALTGAQTYNANWGDVPMLPYMAQMNAGTLTVFYQTTGTPSDYVSVIVERLA